MHISSRFKLTIIFSLLLLFVVGLTLRSFSSTPTHAAKATHGWHIIGSPYVGASSLRSVAAVSASNVWAVGTTYNSPLIEHWNGSQWSIISNPYVSGGILDSVKALSATSIWAIGSSTANGSALIEHYNGKQWSLINSPVPGNWYTTYSLANMTVVSASNIWAAGSLNASDGGNQTLIEHWDGFQWSVIPSPNGDNYSVLNAINAAAANDIWAVGNSWNSPDSSDSHSMLTEHWNGYQWSVIGSPSPGYDNTLNAVVAVSSHDVRAVGSIDSRSYTLAEHWDGVQWTYGNPPNGGYAENALNGEVAFATNNVWAVGSTGNYSPSYVVQPLIEQWNGAHWNIVASPNVAASFSELFGITKVPGNTTTLWAVGDWYNNIYQSLIEFYY